MALTIKSNNVPRNYSYGVNFNGKERTEMLEQFDYLTEEDFNQHRFINYKGFWYDLCDFMLVRDNELKKLKWDGISTDTYFSGVIVRYVEDDEQVVMGTCFS